MEVPGMEDGKSESHLTSPAAFVEGGIQEACEDSCSICLEAFCDSDPGTVTGCKHEFHLQCILEWCQRSSNCPMCWQSISLKDPSSQELLEAVEQERRIRFNPTRNSTIFHHPTLGDFELQHLPVGVNDSELEDRIIQHLAAAAAMGRTHHVGRREGSRNRSAAHNRPQFLVFSTNPNSPSAGPVEEQAEPVSEPAAFTARGGGIVQHMPASGTASQPNSQQGTTVVHRSSSSSTLPNQDRAGPSESQAGSDNWKTRFSAISTRYKESVAKSTRGWKERLFTKSPSMSNIGTEVRREVNAGIANMSRMIERLEVGENNRQEQGHDSSSSNLAARNSDAGVSNHNHVETPGASAGPIVPPPPSTPSPPPPPPPPPPMPLPPSQTYPPHQPTAGSPQVLFLQPSTPQNVHPYQSPMPSNVPLNARLGAHVDPAVRGEMFPQQPSGFNSSRTVDYGHETYTNSQGSLSNQQFQTGGNVSLPPRPFQPAMLPQTATGQFQYPNPGMRPAYPSMYGLTKPPDGPRRYGADEQWRQPSNEFGSDSQRGAWIGSGRSSITSGPPFTHEGYFRPPMERPPSNFQPPGQTIVPAKALIPGHSGSLMVPCRPDLSSLNNWRPS